MEKKRIKITYSDKDESNNIEGDEMVLAIMDGEELKIYAKSSLEMRITLALRILEESFIEDEGLTAQMMTADAKDRSGKAAARQKQPIDLATRRQRKIKND